MVEVRPSKQCEGLVLCLSFFFDKSREITRQRTTAGWPSAEKGIEARKVGRYPRWRKLPGMNKENELEAHLSDPKQASKGELSEVY